MIERSSHTQAELMSEIVAVRYSDLEREKLLCESLLQWAQEASDDFAHAFAYTYLGDCQVAQSRWEDAERSLVKAEKFIAAGEEGSYRELSLRLHSLWGLCREALSDEQGCVQHYLKAVKLAKLLNDATAECIVLNNLAFVLQRHGSYDEALKYYRSAYLLLRSNTHAAVFPLVLSNLAETCALAGQLHDARRYIEELEALSNGADLDSTFSARCWCFYYAALGDREQALVWAHRILALEEAREDNALWAFSNYCALFSCMLDVGDAESARAFLELMERSSSGGIEHVWSFEEMRIKYVLAFEPPDQHLQAFKRFFRKKKEYENSNNRIVVQSMRTQIELDGSIRRREEMRVERESLEQEASVDELTQVYNRRYLNRFVSEGALAQAYAPLGIVMVDVDYFKEYNDRYGHLGGDDVLRTVGFVLRDCCVPGVRPCRFGGDEFACICDGLTIEEVEAYIGAVRDGIANRAIVHESSPYAKLTLSIGYAFVRDRRDVTSLALMQKADDALYASKQEGRNRVSAWSAVKS